MYDDYPARYLTFTRRKHRWIRGDWQLLGWLKGTVRVRTGRMPNRLSAISRWKILDNLRRSLVEISQLAMLIAGWFLLPGRVLQWTGIILVVIAFSWLFSLTISLLRPPRDQSWLAYYLAVGRDAITNASAVDAGCRLPSASGSRIGRRDHPDAVPAVRQPPQSAGVANGVAGGARAGRRLTTRNLAQDVAGDRAVFAARRARSDFT